ncbi:MAG: SH3 domain-containing protein [Proteobacteria bacterium]|nr:MAG: SH3 domain-containing protein [Pseudomonadota bacterium]
MVKVRVPQAILRAGPSQDFPMLTRLTIHEVLRAEKVENNWIKVEKEVYPGTIVSGWMRQDLIEVLKR